MLAKIILAIDSFKGCLASEEVEAVVAETIRRKFPACEVRCLPVADGGEGMLSVLVRATGGRLIPVEVHDPLMRPIRARYGVLGDGETAVIEMAEASGLPLLTEQERNPMLTTSFGTGELIRHALRSGYRKLLVGIGGSATCDGGMGMLQALGLRFYDGSGKELGQGGAVMKQVVRVDSRQRERALEEAQITVACDVQNPFCGTEGAAFVFAPQKGATPEQVVRLDKGLRHWAEVVFQITGKDIRLLPGAGAAGGMGGALYSFLHASLQPGIELLLDAVHFDEELANADLVITGEGRADRQTLMGKVPAGVLHRALSQGVKTVLLAGRIDDTQLLLDAGFTRLLLVTPQDMPLGEALRPETARENIRRAVNEWLRF